MRKVKIDVVNMVKDINKGLRTKSADFILFFFIHTTQKRTSSIKDFFNKCDQIRRKLRIWSHLLKKSLMKNFIFCAVQCQRRI